MKMSNPSFKSYRLVCVALLLMLFVSAAHGQYSLSSFTGKVEIKHAGKVVAAQKDMKLGAADLVVIGQGSSVEILDKRDSQLYSRDIPGEIGVRSLIYEAQKSAGSNSAAVHRKVSFGKPSEEEGKMYVEKGKITLALEEYDPAGENFMIDAKVMAQYIVDMIKAGLPDSLTTFPVPIENSTTEQGGMKFQIDNNSTEPLYINVIKFVLTDDSCQLRISELGQPVGCYVLLPEQSIMRSQNEGLNLTDMHMLVATHYYFSIDELISELKYEIARPASDKPLVKLPIYLKRL